ncbi:hypothetical protein LTR78_001255 [Recurvomyces mirabilis]|uniref:Uncharacterized protein n=1 Tax=Recurvomyces mirabilis TaxID=574656 RepID=A0AAE0WV28_9PEZI|nr:hypothetical protein LTR78_001255 [Recurvomyces mirabilis]KAK5161231.1 hypothetical protein LTS14_001027 [Recurvomyces mirabilis]
MESTTFFRGLLSYMWEGDRNVSKESFRLWICDDETRMTLMQFKREHIDKREHHDQLHNVLDDFSKLKSLKGKIKVPAQQNSTRRVGIVMAYYPIPAVISTGKFYSDDEWKWKAAWSLFFTVLKDLQHDKVGYFVQLLGGPSLFEHMLEVKPAAPRNTLFGNPVHSPSSQPYSSSAGSYTVTDPAPSTKRNVSVAMVPNRLPYRDTYCRSKRGGKAIRKAEAKRAAKDAEVRKRKRDAGEASEDEGPDGGPQEKFFRRDRTRRGAYLYEPVKRTASQRRVE